MNWWIVEIDPDFLYGTGFVIFVKNQSFEFSLVPDRKICKDTVLIFFNKLKLTQYGTVQYGDTVPWVWVISKFYLLIVGKKAGFEVIVVGRGVVVRRIDGVVEVVDGVPVAVRVVVKERSGILGAL